MELNNGVNVILILALSSLLSFSANAICVPRNSTEFQAPASSFAPILHGHATASPPESSSTPPPPRPTEPSKLSGGLDSLNSLSNLMDVKTPSLSSTSELVKICDVTSNPKLCSKSISSHLEGSGTVDPTSALKTEIRASIEEVEKALAKVELLRKDSSVSHTEMECLDICQENFGSAIDDLKAGLESIDGHDGGRMESVLTAVLTNLMTCDDSFAEMGVDSPLDDLTTKMNKYASNCLAISKLLL